MPHNPLMAFPRSLSSRQPRHLMLGCLLIQLFLLLATPGLAQVTSSEALLESQILGRGYDPTKVYDLGRLDAINTYNGNLTLSVPLGPRYQTSGGYSYGLTMSYNSSAWDYQQVVENTGFGGEPTCGDLATLGLPMRDANAGLGWKVSLGDLYAPRGQTSSAVYPNDNPNSSAIKWLFVAPDGSRHFFNSQIHAASSAPVSGSTFYSGDSNFLRLRTSISTSLAYVDFSDGVTYEFEVGVGTYADGVDRWRLRSIWDVSDLPPCTAPGCALSPDDGGRRLSVDYSDTFTWRISDLLGRQHEVRFAASPAGSAEYPKPDRRVIQVDLEGFGGSRLLYDFTYSDPSVVPSLAPPDGDGGYWLSQAERGEIPLLMSLVMPSDGSANPRQSFDFGYWYPGDGRGQPSHLRSGPLASYSLPTGASVDFEHTPYFFPQASSCNVVPLSGASTCKQGLYPVDRSIGVARRTVTDPFDPTASGTWTYIQQLMLPEVLPSTQCPEMRKEMRTLVFGPDSIEGAANEAHDLDIYYYAAFLQGDDESPSGIPWVASDFGLPFTKNVWLEGVAGGPEVFLSSESYEACPINVESYDPNQTPPDVACAGGKKRSQYLRYESDDYEAGTPLPPPGTPVVIINCNETPASCFERNRRLIERRTVFEDDQIGPVASPFAAWRAESMRRWDGLGHFRETITSGNWSSGAGNVLSRHQASEYNPLTGNVDWNTPPNAAGVPGLNDRWLLEKHRRRWTSLAGERSEAELCFEESTGRLLGTRVFEHIGQTALGPHDLLSTFDYDDQGQLAVERYFGGDSQNLPTSSSCAAPASGAAYRRDHSYLHSVLESTRVVTDEATPKELLLSVDNREIDLSSGLVTRAADLTGLVSTADYDWLGRLTRIAPDGGGLRDAATTYTYNPRNGPQRASVRVDRGQTRTVTLFTGFGRPWRTKIWMPSDQNGIVTSLVDRTYWPQGWLRTETSAYRPGVPFAGFTKFRYDFAGRLSKVIRPDGTEAHTAYFGERGRNQTVNFAALGGTQESARWQVSDPWGRLYRLHEGGGGLDYKIDYAYDVGDRLVRTLEKDDAAISQHQQQRTFLYDNRGFLLAESHPEIAGSIAYEGFDALGNAASRTVAGLELGFIFDALGRQTQIWDRTDPQDHRLLSEFFYAGANIGSSRAKAKLYQSRQHNYLPEQPGFAGSPLDLDVVVTQRFDYGGREGRLSSQATQASFFDQVGTQNRSAHRFESTYTYDALGALASQSYPSCTETCTDAAPSRLVDFGYQRGLLSSVAEQSAAGPGTLLSNATSSRWRHR